MPDDFGPGHMKHYVAINNNKWLDHSRMSEYLVLFEINAQRTLVFDNNVNQRQAIDESMVEPFRESWWGFLPCKIYPQWIIHSLQQAGMKRKRRMQYKGGIQLRNGKPHQVKTFEGSCSGGIFKFYFEIWKFLPLGSSSKYRNKSPQLRWIFLPFIGR